MLIEFTVGNYRSFNEPMTLSMEATKLHDNEEIDRNNIFETGKHRLLRSAAIYGHNASGKSNLVKAMMFMRHFVVSSASKYQEGDTIPIKRFTLSANVENAPAFFQTTFLIDNIQYRYGFELDEDSVHSEWLYRKEKRETPLFTRDRGDFYISSSFQKEAGNIDEITRDNALFLSALAQWKSPIAKILLEWFTKKVKGISGLDDRDYGGYTLKRFEKDDVFNKRIQELIRLADVGIASISIEALSLDSPSIPDEVREFVKKAIEQEEKLDKNPVLRRAQTNHPIYKGDEQIGEEVFDMNTQESEGTQKFFYLLGPILDTLENGNILVIDELEARLHPLLTIEIAKMFSSSDANSKNAQLIFTTHNASLLDEEILRRDQIWFTEKDRYGATELYSLAEMSEEKDAAFGKRYLLGRYGATPYFGGINTFLKQELQNG